eukprot:m51a1_g9628 putative riboflavin kinase (165) ;mRNA; f:1131339-1132128
MSSHETPVFPAFLEGAVQPGFGRGSKLLGFPTANLPVESNARELEKLPTGVYYGWACVWDLEEPHGRTVHKMAMSVGKNPFFHSEAKTVEVHIVHSFPQDFYGKHVKAIVVGLRRPMCTFNSIDELKKAIREDVEYTEAELDKPAGARYQTHEFFSSPPGQWTA